MNSSVIIDENFQRAIQDRVFSGAQVLAGLGRQRKFQGCYGSHSWDPQDQAVAMESRFDVASLTKPLVTAMLAYRAVKGGTLDLQEPVQKYLREFSHADTLSIAQLLAHTSGLPAWLPLYEDFQKGKPDPAEVKRAFIRRISTTPLLTPPGQDRVYSDLGYLLLGFALEELGEASLDQLFQDQIASPLSLSHSNFNPLQAGVPAKAIVATEEGDWRKKLLRGEVHDDNAYVLGGVAGHAGLFSTAADIEKMIFQIWDQWSEPEWQEFVGPAIQPKLGWDSPSPNKSQAGKFFQEQAIGHLAFTGCSLWLDPVDQKYLILLTNRVHPNRNSEVIKEFRPLIHDLIFEQLDLPS